MYGHWGIQIFASSKIQSVHVSDYNIYEYMLEVKHNLVKTYFISSKNIKCNICFTSLSNCDRQIDTQNRSFSTSARVLLFSLVRNPRVYD